MFWVGQYSIGRAKDSRSFAKTNELYLAIWCWVKWTSKVSQVNRQNQKTNLSCIVTVTNRRLDSDRVGEEKYT